MADEQAVTLADSASPAPAATDPIEGGQAAEPTEATHGEATERATSTDDTPAPSEATPADDDDEEHEEAPDPDLSPEEQKSKAQQRRERRRAREAERIQQSVDEALARKEQERAAADARRDQEAAAKAAAEARIKRFAEYLGEPDKPDGTPGTLRRLDAEIDALVVQLASPDIWARPGDEIDAVQKDLAAKRAHKASLVKANGLASEIENVVWDAIRADFTSAAEFPELASDPVAKARYLNAAGGVRGGLTQLREAIVRAKDAEREAALKAQADQHATAIATLTTERNSWRTRAGGEEVPTTTNGGQAESSSLTLTPARYAAMTYEERQQLRATPEGRQRIDRMMRAGAA